MPLGDSITKGGGCESPISYRQFLSDSLKAHGIEFDFLGSRSCTEDFGYDTDNQGMAGWTSGNILTGHPEDTSGTLYDWAPRYRPDIVLIHLGTNDVAQNFTAEQVLANLTEIVRILRAENSQIRIFLAKILPMMERWGMKERAVILNDSIAVLASRLQVALVDQYSGIVPEEDLYDGTHPNHIGYGKMAVKWFWALYPQLGPATLPTMEKFAPGALDANPGWLVNGRTPVPGTPMRTIKKNPRVR